MFEALEFPALTTRGGEFEEVSDPLNSSLPPCARARGELFPISRLPSSCAKSFTVIHRIRSRAGGAQSKSNS